MYFSTLWAQNHHYILLYISDDRKRSSVDKWYFSLSADEWSKIEVVETKYNASLRKHASIFSEKISETNKYCVLRFTYNRVRKLDSRKSRAPFFSGKAICTFGNCMKYEITIKKNPSPDKHVKVKVKARGEQNHDGSIKRRHIAGDQRNKMSNQRGSPAEIYYENLRNADNDKLRSGNYNNVPSKACIRQMVAEVTGTKDIQTEVDIIIDVVNSFYDGGYIQCHNRIPFATIMHTQQIELFVDLARKKKCFLYFDATGSVVKKIKPCTKRVLYYALVAKVNKETPAIPIAEFLTSSHTVIDINYFLSRVEQAAARVSVKFKTPNKVETDYSWALIHSTIQTFNKMTTSKYMTNVWEGLMPKCVLHICAAHVMKKISDKIRDKSKDLKEFIMICMANFIDSKSREDVDTLFTLMCNLLLPKHTLDLQALGKIKLIFKEGHARIKIDVDNNIDGSVNVSEQPWTKQTPYYKHFKSIVDTTDVGKESGTNNSYYSPDIITLLLDHYMCILPL